MREQRSNSEHEREENNEKEIISEKRRYGLYIYTTAQSHTVNIIHIIK